MFNLQTCDVPVNRIDFIIMINPNLQSIVNNACLVETILGTSIPITKLNPTDNKCLTNTLLVATHVGWMMKLGNNSFGDFALRLLHS